MSLGYGGYMDLVADDGSTLMYTYCCYNINHTDYKKHMEPADGEITISRNALIEPEIQSRIKKQPSGRKRLVEKRVRQDVPLEHLIDSGKITVKNASGTWYTNANGIDVIAFKILFKLFNEYQDTGTIPKHISLFS